MRGALLVLIASAATARADGLYVSEGIGATKVGDAATRYLDGGMYVRGAVGVRSGAWATEVWFAGVIDLGCCNDIATYGLAVKYLQPVSKHVELYLRGSASAGEGDGLLRDYGGRGLGVGAGLQLKGKVRALGLLWWPLFFSSWGPKITGALFVEDDYEFYRLHRGRDAFVGRPPERVPGSVDTQLSHFLVGWAFGSDF